MVLDIQRASMWKRISAYIFDGILLGIVVVGIAFLMSAMLGYDSHVQKFNDIRSECEAEYGIELDGDYNALTDEEKARYEAAFEKLSSNDEAQYAYSMMISLTLVITSISILVGYVALEFVVPLLFKNGQTLGKKIFGVALMRNDGVRITTFALFVRTVFGKYTIETMVPIFILLMIIFGNAGIIGTISLLLIALLQLILIAVTHARTAIHDLIACTVAVDYASQLIFDTPEALTEYKKKLHAEQTLYRER